MTRDEHRRQAESLLGVMIDSPEEGQLLMARALVHALLALSAPNAEATAAQLAVRTVFSGDARP